jgi:Transglycosylase
VPGVTRKQDQRARGSTRLRGQQGAVGGLQSGSWNLAAQHSQLVAQDQDLQVLGGVAAREQGEQQVGLAIKLDACYSKAQILGMYLDSVYFGDGHWGIVQASQGYFGKPPARLSGGRRACSPGWCRRRPSTIQKCTSPPPSTASAAEAGRLGFTSTPA